MPRNRKRSSHAALCRFSLSADATAHLHGDLGRCDFDVTGSCDVISPDHFERGFYYSSFRRCGLNFLVLQKDNKILVHNISDHEKLEQSTHWNILKKWGKDYTFGSGCTVRFLYKAPITKHFLFSFSLYYHEISRAPCKEALKACWGFPINNNNKTKSLGKN